MDNKIVEVFWGKEWIRPDRWKQLDKKTINATVITRKGYPGIVRFRNSREYTAWRAVNA